MSHRNSSDNRNNAFKSVARRRFWSWPSANVFVFYSDLHKVKTLTHIVDEKQVKIKHTIKIISSFNASQTLLVSEVLLLVKLILKALATNAVSKWSCSTLLFNADVQNLSIYLSTYLSIIFPAGKCRQTHRVPQILKYYQMLSNVIDRKDNGLYRDDGLASIQDAKDTNSTV